MTPFDFITVALSLVLGLGITYLLSSAVQMFRSRDVVALDWIALAWAAIILFWQLQFWWAIYELSKIIQIWTIQAFAVLVALALILFVSGALILPSGNQDIGQRASEAFKRDGRWALVLLSAHFGASLGANRLLFGTPVFSIVSALVASLMVVPLLFLMLRTRRSQMATIATYMVLSLWVASLIAPTSY